jgi:hypothetical protein
MTKSQTGYVPSKEVERELDDDRDAPCTGESPDKATNSGPWRNTSADKPYLKKD